MFGRLRAGNVHSPVGMSGPSGVDSLVAPGRRGVPLCRALLVEKNFPWRRESPEPIFALFTPEPRKEIPFPNLDFDHNLDRFPVFSRPRFMEKIFRTELSWFCSINSIARVHKQTAFLALVLNFELFPRASTPRFIYRSTVHGEGEGDRSTAH